MACVDYEYYSEAFGGGLSEAAFGGSVALAESHVRWLCELRDCYDVCERFKRVVCAACEAFAEYGSGEVGEYAIGSFSVKNYENNLHDRFSESTSYFPTSAWSWRQLATSVTVKQLRTDGGGYGRGGGVSYREAEPHRYVYCALTSCL